MHDIFTSLLVAQHAHGQPEREPMVALVELIERVKLLPTEGGQQLLVGGRRGRHYDCVLLGDTRPLGMWITSLVIHPHAAVALEAVGEEAGSVDGGAVAVGGLEAGKLLE